MTSPTSWYGLPRWLALSALLSVLARCLLLGAPELLPEEAYYWNYAVHLAPGYLDHPPLSAWLIAAGTKLFGLTEFGVRSGALLCCLITAAFVFYTALRVADRTAAAAAVAICVLAPYFVGNGFFITPDAPMVAAWAAAIYFLVCIIQGGHKVPLRHWLGLGVSLGLGLLSKYSIALLGFAALITFIVDRDLRRWFLRPQPYLAAVLAAAIFSPVIYWNATHEWASFAFQGTRRLSEPVEFSLHESLAHLLLMVSPVGIFVALAVLLGKARGAALELHPREARFLKLAFAVPVAVFLFSSLRHQPRFTWMGPPFLAMLPFLGAHLAAGLTVAWPGERLARAGWKVFLLLTISVYAAFWIFMGVGVPGLGYSAKWKKLLGWENLSVRSLEIARELTSSTGKEAFILGMDKHYTAAELAFYTAKNAAAFGMARPTVVGRAAVGIESLMWNFWSQGYDLTGQSAVIVTRYRGDLEFPELAAAFESLGPIEEYRASANGKPAGLYVLRRGYGFRGAELIKNLHSQPGE